MSEARDGGLTAKSGTLRILIGRVALEGDLTIPAGARDRKSVV
jgi:hypothetical protein